MTSNAGKTSLIRWDLCALAVFFVPACFIFVWKALRTHLIYAAFGDLMEFPTFVPDRAFFLERVSAAGGPAKYISDLLSQYLYYDLAGAFIITLLAIAFYLATLVLIRTAANLRSHVLAAVPAVAVVAFHADYNHRVSVLLALLISVSCAAAFLAFRPRSSLAAAVCFAALFAALYWAVAAVSLVFAVLVSLAELLHRQWVSAISQAAIAAALAAAMGVWLFQIPMPHPFSAGLPIFPLGTALRTPGPAHMILFFPAALLAAAAIRRLASRLAARDRMPPKRAAARRRKRRDAPQNTRRRIPESVVPWLRTAVAAIVIGAAAVLSVGRAYDPDRKHALQMNVLFRDRQWQAYIDAARALYRRGYWDLRVNHGVNRALYHKGTLLDDMFAFPQNGAALTMMTAQGLPFGATFTRVSDLFFEMGNINGAEQWAYEVLESEGPSPLVLNRLVDINLAKNQSAVAAVFLRALSKDIVHGRAAKERLRTIESDLAIADPRIQHARDMYWKTDKVLKYNTPEKFLLDLLEQHPDNRMAFEYLMAFYLLIHDQQKIIDNLHRLDTLGYDRIPRHLEEAIMVHADKTRSPVDLKGRPISRQTVERHRRYLERFKQAGGSKDVAMRVLAPEFGGSYFFYSMFGFSGVGQ